jgi:hypothetical protein
VGTSYESGTGRAKMRSINLTIGTDPTPALTTTLQILAEAGISTDTSILLKPQLGPRSVNRFRAYSALH